VVLGADVRLLANPLVLKLGFGFVIMVGFTLLAMLMMRKLKNSITEEAQVDTSAPRESGMELHTFNAVIQGLKQQKQEIQALHNADRKRAQAAEAVSAAVIANLPCGVLFFSLQGLVRQANPAAKRILGFESPAGLSVGQIFGWVADVEEAARRVLQEAREVCDLEITIQRPAGDARMLSLRLVPVTSPSQERAGMAVLITDLSAASVTETSAGVAHSS
jgi:PAS domain S-box-containing protein